VYKDTVSTKNLSQHFAGPPELGEQRSPSKNGRERRSPQFDHWL